MERAWYRLRHAGLAVFLCAGGVFLAVLVMAARHPAAAEKAPALAALIAVGVTAMLLFARLKFMVLAASTATLFVLGQAATATFLAATDWSLLGARLAALVATLGVLASLGLLKPAARIATEHRIDADAPPERAWRALLPAPDGRYWKPTMSVTPAPDQTGAFDFRVRSEGESAEATRILVEVVELGRQARFVILKSNGQEAGRQTYMLEPHGDGVSIRSRFELRRPTLFFFILHAALDLPSDELRRFKAHLEGRSCAGFGASL